MPQQRPLALLACVSFMQANGGLNLHVPAQVDSLVKNRIRTQYAARHHEELRFDDANCKEKGTYYYTMDSIVLQSTAEHFNGRMETSISDAIDGRQLDFPGKGSKTSDKIETIAHLDATLPDNEKTEVHELPKWVPWVLGIGAALAMGGMVALHARGGGSTASAAAGSMPTAAATAPPSTPPQAPSGPGLRRR